MKVWFSDTTFCPKGFVKVGRYIDAVHINAACAVDEWFIDEYCSDAVEFLQEYEPDKYTLINTEKPRGSQV